MTDTEAHAPDTTEEQPQSLFIISGIILTMYGVFVIIGSFLTGFNNNSIYSIIFGISLLISGFLCLKTRHRAVFLLTGMVFFLESLLSLFISYYYLKSISYFTDFIAPDVFYKSFNDFLSIMKCVFFIYSFFLFFLALSWLSFRNYKRVIKYDRICIILFSAGVVFSIIGIAINFLVSYWKWFYSWDWLLALVAFASNASLLWIALRSYRKAPPWDMTTERSKGLRVISGVLLILYGIYPILLGLSLNDDRYKIILGVFMIVIGILCFTVKHGALFVVTGIAFFFTAYFCIIGELIFVRPILYQISKDLSASNLGTYELSAEQLGMIFFNASFFFYFYSLFFLNVSLCWLSFRNVKRSIGYDRLSIILLCCGITLSILGLAGLIIFSTPLMKNWRLAIPPLIALVPNTIVLWVVSRGYKDQKQRLI